MNKKTAFFALQKSLRKTALQTINKFINATTANVNSEQEKG